jgi:hypothetical protein
MAVAVTKTETVIVSSIFGAVAFLVIGVVSATISDNKAKNESAVAAGFADFREMDAASKLGISDPIKWRAKVVADRRAQDESERVRRAKVERDAADAAANQAKELADRFERERPAIDRMSLSNQSWEISGFGTVGLMSMTITNKNSYSVRDITINCIFNGRSGTQLSTTLHTIYDKIPANTSRRFAKVNVGFIHSQSARAGCSLVAASK